MKILFIILLMHSLAAQSAETDGFTERYRPMPDAVPMINAELERRVNLALVRANLDNDSTACSWSELNDALGIQLRRPIFGVLEEFIEKSKTLPKANVNFDQSVFQHFPVTFILTIKAGMQMGLGFAPAIYHQGLLVGGDKFGHFMDEGYYYYTLVNTWNQPLEKIFSFGNMTENTYNGKWSSGIYSFADLAANYDGYLFWTDLLGTPKSRNSKYFACETGDWKLKKPIDLADYISPAWDEGMNCNDFRSNDMYMGLDIAVKELEQKTGKRFRCPVYPERIQEMINRYEPYASKIIHPSILSSVPNSK